MRRQLAAIVVACCATLVPWPGAQEGETVVAREGLPSRFLIAPTTVQVQYVLRSFGYSVPVNGVLDARTVKAIKHFQRASGLLADGIVGTITWAAMTGGTQAVRLNPPTFNPAGLRGMPFAPAGLDACDEMAWYAAQAGLPDTVNVRDGTGGFDALPTREQASFAEQAIGRRESGCNNGAANSFAGGYWGIAWSNLNAPGYRPFTSSHCNAFVRNDIVGDNPLAKQKQGCTAKILLDWWVSHPGSPWPWRL